MAITKDLLRKELEKMPDEFSIEELLDRLVLVEKINQGMNDVKEGRVISHENMEKEIKQWFK